MTALRKAETRLDAADLPEPRAVLDAYGLSCGQLEPLIAEHLRALAPGEILEVRSDQVAAEEGIGAWSWLSGNALVAVRHEDPPRARYYVRRKLSHNQRSEE